MTADIYSHLLDGDLKVKDELVFDKEEKTNDNFIHRQSNDEKFDSVVKAIQALAALNPKEMRKLLETQTEKKSEELVPRLLRETTDKKILVETRDTKVIETTQNIESENAVLANNAEALESILDLDGSDSKNGGLERVRTYDLLIRSQVL